MTIFTIFYSENVIRILNDFCEYTFSNMKHVKLKKNSLTYETLSHLRRDFCFLCFGPLECSKNWSSGNFEMPIPDLDDKLIRDCVPTIPVES